MSGFKGRLRWCVAAAAAGSVALGAAPAAADPIVDPGPVAPGQFFIGLVNGITGHARVAVACDGPASPDRTGHPIAGQLVRAMHVPAPTPSAAAGFTGDAGTSLQVVLVPSRQLRPIELRFYQTGAAIPTTAVVPCEGSGEARFVPAPTSPTATAATVQVVFFPAVA